MLQNTRIGKFATTALCLFGFIFFISNNAQANPTQIKAYKEAFPGETPKCTYCHTDAIPKKEDGKHDFNAYGQAVKKENAKPTAETYKKLGKSGDFLKAQDSKKK